mgnify:CR=1 FL=1
MAHEQKTFLGIDWLYSTYMWVWAALLILTVVEVIVPEPSLIGLAKFPRTVTVLSLIILALIKTFAVAWYYMHLIDERPSIILIACAPFVFSVFLTIGLWPHLPPHSQLNGEPGYPPAGAEESPSSGGESASDGEQSRLDSRPDAPSRHVGPAEGMQLADQALSRR